MAFLDETGLAELWKLICSKHDGFVNEHLWKRTLTAEAEIPAKYTLGEVQTNVEIFSVELVSDVVEWIYNAAISVNDDGTINIGTDAFAPTMQWFANNLTASLPGNFVQFIQGTNLDTSAVYYIPSDATVNVGDFMSGDLTATVSKIQLVTGHAKIEAGSYLDYVNSPDINAYPPSQDDVYTYTYLGQLGNKVQIATGSYTGTGTYGASNPCSLTFDFKPLFVAVISGRNGASNELYHIFAINGQTLIPGVPAGSSTVYDLTGQWDGKTFSWYSTDSTTVQLNYSGATYYYFAAG